MRVIVKKMKRQTNDQVKEEKKIKVILIREMINNRSSIFIRLL